ncbi:RDD family protein [Metabacillus sp. 84]|uniref:RDD family protein n=1 Tax=Metabacillus sp. 84 TaxID=3404705 RepID=UPI003CF86C2F
MGRRYAGAGQRLVAQLIDSLMIMGIWGLILMILALIPDTVVKSPVSVIIFILGSAASLFYQIAMPASHFQGTLGKYWMGLKIVDESGGQISIGKSIVRVIGLNATGTFPLLYLFVVFNTNHQGLHDMMASTSVLKYDKNPAMQPGHVPNAAS